ncbi:hypothetical protein [Streptomyces sp. NPDC088726]|uniref:hypothetical protein n=1 Tax=Streptomyces sp. NPDC088726 TaxID=3365874 RepID=UPI00381FBF74
MSEATSGVLAWREPLNLGGTFAGDPAPARNENGGVFVIARGTDGIVRVRLQEWFGDWQDPEWYPNPEAAAAGEPRTGWAPKADFQGSPVFFRGTDGNLHFAPQEVMDGPLEKQSEIVVRTIGGDPAPVYTDRWSVFFRGSDGALWHAGADKSAGQSEKWSSMVSLGGNVQGRIAATVLDDTTPVSYHQAADTHIYASWPTEPGSRDKWTAKRVVSNAGGPPAVHNWPDPHRTTRHVLFRGNDGALWRLEVPAARSWTEVAKIGGTGVTGVPALAYTGDDRAVGAYRDGSNRLYVTEQLQPGGTAWSTPKQVATDVASNPAFGTRADGNVLQLFYRATDNTIRVLTQDTGAG